MKKHKIYQNRLEVLEVWTEHNYPWERKERLIEKFWYPTQEEILDVIRKGEEDE